MEPCPKLWTDSWFFSVFFRQGTSTVDRRNVCLIGAADACETVEVPLRWAMWTETATVGILNSLNKTTVAR